LFELELKRERLETEVRKKPKTQPSPNLLSKPAQRGPGLPLSLLRPVPPFPSAALRPKPQPRPARPHLRSVRPGAQRFNQPSAPLRPHALPAPTDRLGPHVSAPARRPRRPLSPLAVRPAADPWAPPASFVSPASRTCNGSRDPRRDARRPSKLGRGRRNPRASPFKPPSGPPAPSITPHRRPKP